VQRRRELEVRGIETFRRGIVEHPEIVLASLLESFDELVLYVVLGVLLNVVRTDERELLISVVVVLTNLGQVDGLVPRPILPQKSSRRILLNHGLAD
jgi:hypothetical protein